LKASLSRPREEVDGGRWSTTMAPMGQLLLRVAPLFVLPAATAAEAPAGSGSGPRSIADSSWNVDPITVKIAHTRRAPFGTSSKTVDLAGMRGECERAQIWGWNDENDLSDVTVAFAALATADGASLPASQWSYKQQGYVNASTPTKYTCLEDVLAPPDSPPPPSPPPVDTHNCSLTPWNQCWTGCPNVAKNWSDPNSCAGGKVWPIPSEAQTASVCLYNQVISPARAPTPPPNKVKLKLECVSQSIMVTALPATDVAATPSTHPAGTRTHQAIPASPAGTPTRCWTYHRAGSR
jgi:hypothetical protein